MENQTKYKLSCDESRLVYYSDCKKNAYAYREKEILTGGCPITGGIWTEPCCMKGLKKEEQKEMDICLIR